MGAFARGLALLVLLLAMTGCASAATEKGSFIFDDWAGPPLTVYTAVPGRAGRDAPVVFVMHGVGRNAEDYRDTFTALAEEAGFILVAPEYSRAAFAGAARYNLGWLFDETGALRPEAEWTFSAIEPLFDAVRARTGSRRETYFMFGHSAGAQFVHRYVLMKPDARLDRAVSANAGWYTLARFDIDWPYGLNGAPVDEAQLIAWLGADMVVLLGEADIDPDAANLRRTPRAEAQGPHRLARGENFFAAAAAAAQARGVAFGWRKVAVPLVGHDHAAMAPAAVEALFGAAPLTNPP